MKTRYKIIIIAVCAYFGVFLGPVAVSNVYCDFVPQEMCTSRITGVNLPPFNMIPLSLPNDNECFFENTEGVMEPCYIETGYFEWPFPPRMYEYEHDSRCDEICLDDARDDLKEVVYASTPCSVYWRGELFEMWNNSTYDYRNDPIYQECLEMQQAKDRCLVNDHIWNKNGTCTLTTVYPNVSGMGLKYAKYVTGNPNECWYDDGDGVVKPCG